MKKFSAEFQPGFMVILRFQIQLHPNEQDGGMLYYKGLSTTECWVNIRHEQKDLVAESEKTDSKVTNIKSKRTEKEEADA